MDVFVNLCIYNKGGLIVITFYSPTKWFRSSSHSILLFFAMSLPPNQMHDTLPLIFTITPTRHFCNINTIFYFHYERFSHTDLVLNTIIYNACSNWFQFPTVTHLVHMQPLFLHLQKWLLQVTLFQNQFYQHIKTDRPIEAETTQKRNEFLQISLWIF